MKRLILASSSPRRREILNMLGVEFEVIPAHVEETTTGKPILDARRLSKEKALSVWRNYKDFLVLGADTLVFIEGKAVGKPKDEEEAFSTLSLLSGRWHRVVTAVSLIGKGIRLTIHDVARVKFKKLSSSEIRKYIETGEPMDKAGAYGVQGYGATLIENICGDFYTVMGLPVHKLTPLLRKLSIL